MDICIFGAGSLGSLVGGLLAATNDVTLVGREEHVETIQNNGLQIQGTFDRTVEVNAQTEPPVEGDLVIVTVKSFDTASAAESLAGTEYDAALSLQNGMGNEEILTTELDFPVLAGTCTYGARRTAPGVVECTGIGDVALGPPEGGTSELAESVGGALQPALAVTIADDMPRRLWAKLTVNAGINAVTALARIPNGEIADGPASDVARAAAQEASRAAESQGVSLGEPADEAVAVAESTAENRSSMYQDVERGHRTEIDAINGYVVEHTNEAVPVNATLTGLVRAWERGHGLRE